MAADGDEADERQCDLIAQFNSSGMLSENIAGIKNLHLQIIVPQSICKKDRVNGGSITMKATGIVRRIDDLGRIVIPKEIRRTLRIRESDPL